MSEDPQVGTARTIAIFADQIKPGMVIEHPGSGFPERFGGKVLVTQHRIEEARNGGIFGDMGATVFILGERVEDGSAYHYCAGRSMVWLCHEAAL
ncbi:MAG TPA: hypothetical protein VIJ31_12095 [Acidothermaceae bacterium]